MFRWKKKEEGKNIFRVSTRVFGTSSLEKCRQSDRLSGCNRGGGGGGVKALIYGTAPPSYPRREAEETSLNIGVGEREIDRRETFRG